MKPIADSFGFKPQRVRDLLKRGDRASAVKYIHRYVDRGSIRAMISMADVLYDEGDMEGSLRWFATAERATAKDDMESLIYLASGYSRGLGKGTALQRLKKALKLHEQVGEMGNSVVIRELITTYTHGLNGARPSKAKVNYWSRKLAD